MGLELLLFWQSEFLKHLRPWLLPQAVCKLDVVEQAYNPRI